MSSPVSHPSRESEHERAAARRSSRLLDDRRVERPDDRTVRTWFRQWRVDGEVGYRDVIVEAHHWLVRVCARQIRRHDEPLEDLEQVGNIGLLHAVDRFDLDVGVLFRTYASATVEGELRRHYRSVWRLRTPRSVQEMYLRVGRAREELSMRDQRSPTPAAIAAHLDVPIDAVIEAIGAGLNQVPSPLFAGGDGVEGSEDRCLGVEDANIDNVGRRASVRALLAELPQREATVLYLRYYHDFTQAEIAGRMGLSQVHVSRLMRAGLARLRDRSDRRS